MRKIQRKYQRGVVLIVVLFAMAVISTLAINASEKSRFNTARVTNHSAYQQAYWYALGGEHYAKQLLKRDLDQHTTHLEQAWAIGETTYEIVGGEIGLKIVDLNSCFNINSLVQGGGIPLGTHHQVFVRFLSGLQFPTETIEVLRERVQDWIDPDSLATGVNGMEYGYQTDSGVMYGLPNSYMHDISEVSFLLDISPDLMRKLQTHLCSLPSEYRLLLNINTLREDDALLLASVFRGELSQQEAYNVIISRPKAGYSDIADVWKLPELLDKELDEVDKASLDLKSTYFRADIEVRYEDVVRSYHAWFKAENGNIRTIARQYGERF